VTQLGSGGIDCIDAVSDFSIQRIVVAAIVGGTASAASGGNFANGAMVGAFSRAFNDELSSREARELVESGELAALAQRIRGEATDIVPMSDEELVTKFPELQSYSEDQLALFREYDRKDMIKWGTSALLLEMRNGINQGAETTFQVVIDVTPLRRPTNLWERLVGVLSPPPTVTATHGITCPVRGGQGCEFTVSFHVTR